MSCSSVNISDSHIRAPAARVISSTLVAMPRSAREFLNFSSCVKYADMLVVGSHAVLYPASLYSYFCYVVILIAVFVRRWRIIDWTVSSPKLMYCFFNGARASSPTP